MLKLPVGIEDFAEIRQLGFYYIDKTKLIEQLLNGWGKVSLLLGREDLEKACQKAMEQIKDRRYEEFLRNDGRNEILAYGIAFCRKRCKVIMEKM